MSKGVIYKYRNWENDFHKDVLRENEIYFASPIMFNDPFDSKISENLLLIDTEEKREEFAEHIVNESKNDLILMGKDPVNVKSNFKERLKNNLSEEHLFNEIQEFENANKLYGIFSGSRTWKSVLMWSHYGNNHKGICIGFKEDYLLKSSNIGWSGDVDYLNDFPIRDPLNFNMNIAEESFMKFYTKAEEWRYEEEYRLVISNIYGLADADRLMKLNSESIAEVVLGIEFEDGMKQEIMDICRSKKIKVYQAKKVPFKFEITREEIN